VQVGSLQIGNWQSRIGNSLMSTFLQTLKERIVVFDGAMGTNLHAQDLTVDDYGGPQFEGCPEHLLISKPEAVEKVHAGFFEVGCDVVETDSFGGASIVLAEYGIAHLAYELNKKAAELAKRVASDFSTKEKPRWVAGSMGPTTKLPTLGHISFLDMKASYREQARGLLDGGADLLIVETCQDILQTKSALAAIFEEFESLQRRVPDCTSHHRSIRHDAHGNGDRCGLHRPRAIFDRHSRHELRNRPTANGRERSLSLPEF
jgi:5-methyltetrahydrofolate--homocysteine methyltransferase